MYSYGGAKKLGSAYGVTTDNACQSRSLFSSKIYFPLFSKVDNSFLPSLTILFDDIYLNSDQTNYIPVYPTG